VSSAVVQRYLDHVLEAALSQNASIQSVAIDVLTFTVKQGLAHPLQSFPVIVALETSPIVSISNRAGALHAILQGKHASLLNARYIVSARKSFEYQKKIVAGPVQGTLAASRSVFKIKPRLAGFRVQPTPVALLHRWYCHVREKRAARQDFLKSLVKFVQENGSLESTQVVLRVPSVDLRSGFFIG
jgi:cohesin loading factor subunit SCC2